MKLVPDFYLSRNYYRKGFKYDACISTAYIRGFGLSVPFFVFLEKQLLLR